MAVESPCPLQPDSPTRCCPPVLTPLTPLTPLTLCPCTTSTPSTPTCCSLLTGPSPHSCPPHTPHPHRAAHLHPSLPPSDLPWDQTLLEYKPLLTRYMYTDCYNKHHHPGLSLLFWKEIDHQSFTLCSLNVVVVSPEFHTV